MQHNLERRSLPPADERALHHGATASADKAHTLRQQLRHSLRGLLDGSAAVRLPRMPSTWVLRGEGHFHLVPELFLQITGPSRFVLPHETLELQPGEILLLPPRMLHSEQLPPTPAGPPFSNLVVYASGMDLSCHLARETQPERPGIDHLEATQHPHAARIHDWLAEAARLGWEPGAAHADSLVAAQTRALVAAACAGVLRVLDDPQPRARPEPPLVAHVRTWVQNQLGDHALNVTQLAAQAGCTPEYLSHLFNKTTGGHLVGYINRLRMERAAQLLADTQMAGKEIAWACGFETPSYFIRMFRTHYGTTPKQWRTRRQDEGLPA
jgi:AraC-like DNA-binding protein